MRTFPRFLSRQTARFYSAKRLFERKTPCFLPFYHTVSDKKLPHVLNYPYRNILQFEKELDFFLKYFQPVSLEELISGKCSGEKGFHLSFDDGLRECAEVIAPVLLKKGIPATFFLNSAFVDNKALFHKYKASLVLNRLRESPDAETETFLKKHQLGGNKILTATILQTGILNEAAEKLGIDFSAFLKNQKPYLTTEQVKKLAADGFSIGAHSHSHPEFWLLSSEKQVDEVKKSMALVDKLVKPGIRTFAFPFTDWGVPAGVFETIREEQICDITFGTAGVKQDMFDSHLQRYPAEQSGDFKRNLKGEFVYFEWRKMAGKGVVKHEL